MELTKILCIGESEQLVALRCAVLDRHGYEAQCANVSLGLQFLRNRRYDLVLADSSVPQDVLKLMRALHPNVFTLERGTAGRELVQRTAQIFSR